MNHLYNKGASKKEILESLFDNKEAYYLLNYLKVMHFDRKHFAISQEEFSTKYGCSRVKLSNMIKVLLENKLLFRKEKAPKKTIKNGKLVNLPYTYSFIDIF